MPPARTKTELQFQKNKLASSYTELLDEFSSKDLRHVGNYTLGRLIGKGSFGKVYLATHNLTNGSKVVLKSANKDDANLAREIHHHRQFLHPHIARLYEVIVTEKLVWLVLEYCPGDELYNYLLCHGAIPVEKVQKIFTQLVGAVAYVHNMSCVHRDLKLENILLDKNENVKLCDFGFTREYEGKASYLQTFCGTVCYSAPEMLKGEKYAGEKVDVWSLGIILFALLTGELPYDEDDDNATKAKILKEDPKYPEGFPEDAKSLVTLLLSKRPLLRPTLSDVLAHPFLAEYAPNQQAVLKLAQPAPFATPLEKTTLERMRSAGVDIDQLIENVLSQRCDGLAGWWALLIEKEARKERRREQKRKEREAEMKNLRRLSAASSRLERIAPPLVEVDEEGHSPAIDDSPRARGRRERRSIPTPQIVLPDLPKLPEGAVVDSPGSSNPPPPIEKDPVRSASSSRHRPPPPPKEVRRSRGSTLQLVSSSPDLLSPNGVVKRRASRRRQHPIMNQLASLKHWLVESAKRARSPGKGGGSSTTSTAFKFLPEKSSPPKDPNSNRQSSNTPIQPHHPPNHRASTTSSTLTPTSAHYTTANPRSSSLPHPRPPNTNAHHRNSLSPSSLTPHSSYRRSSAGLRGRKSTSSSVSSIRSIHHVHTHSKASSTSSNSIGSVSTPTTKSATAVSRSPHTSIKVLTATPTATSHFPSNIRVVRAGSVNIVDNQPTYNESAPAPIMSSPSSGLVFARRKKSAFKGPMLNPGLFNVGTVGSGPGTPGLSRSREGSAGNLGRSASGRAGRRKSQIIEEEEEAEEDVEEVDAFSPLAIHGEEIVWEDGPKGETSEVDKAQTVEEGTPDGSVNSQKRSPASTIKRKELPNAEKA